MKLVLITKVILMFNCFDRFLLKVTTVSKKVYHLALYNRIKNVTG
jgi:hypothetical protein